MSDTNRKVRCERFNEVIAELRDQQGLSANDIAATIKMPPQYLSDMRRDRRRVTELTARRLGDAYGINYAWLLGWSDTKVLRLAAGWWAVESPDGTLYPRAVAASQEDAVTPVLLKEKRTWPHLATKGYKLVRVHVEKVA